MLAGLLDVFIKHMSLTDIKAWLAIFKMVCQKHKKDCQLDHFRVILQIVRASNPGFEYLKKATKQSNTVNLNLKHD